jgi:hypothetical protein
MTDLPRRRFGAQPNSSFGVPRRLGLLHLAALNEKEPAMLGKSARIIALTAAMGLGAASAAQAAIGDGVLGARGPLTSATQIENAQFIFGGRNYCWYDNGWQGPGWYWCGYALRTGFGFGGGAGWHGWGRGGRGGHRGGGGPVIHGGMSHGGAHFSGGHGGHGHGGHGPRKH